ncbi:MAG: TIGR02452 family protein, partial [Trueperaceae bacterium]
AVEEAAAGMHAVGEVERERAGARIHEAARGAQGRLVRDLDARLGERSGRRRRQVGVGRDADLPVAPPRAFAETRVQVTNETTLGAARRLVDAGARPLALNFANGVHPGGGFLDGARAQEEVLCRSSALVETLVGDPMYAEHARRPRPDSSDWAIYSPGVPVFRTDDGATLPRPWPLDFVTCAAPYAPAVGQPESGDLLERRIRRVLAIARAYGHAALVLGAWGCGAFHNDPVRTAQDFRAALEGEFAGAFAEVVFAVVDWSQERRNLGPFRDAFAGAG